MEDYLYTSIVLAVGALVHVAVLRRAAPEEHRFLTLSFLGHALSALVHVWLVLYYFPGGGDMLGYFAEGIMGAELLRSDFWTFAPELAAAFLRTEAHLPIEIGGGSSTGSMGAAAGFILFLSGDSLYSSCMLIAVGAYLSQYAIFLALRSFVPARQQRLVLGGSCLIPTGVYWSSGLFKEGLIMVALGPLVLALSWLARGQRHLLASVIIAAASGVLLLIKPYVLMALSVAASVFYLRQRFREAAPELRPFALGTAVVMAMGGLTVGGWYLDKGRGESSATSLAGQRRVGYANQGGSDYYLDAPTDVGDTAERSLSQELLLAPLGLATAWFRPLVFEARNAVQFANSLEATFLLVLCIQIVRRLGWRGALSETLASPVLLFCAAFAFSLGLGTGMASSNLGTLSRYRAPMMPFFFSLLLVLRYGLPSRLEAEASSRRAAARAPWPRVPLPAGTRAPEP